MIDFYKDNTKYVVKHINGGLYENLVLHLR